MHSFSEQEIREVLTRAEEIHQRGTAGAALSESEVIVRAAEEAGLPREAVEQAIRERFGLPSELPKKGELIFARSSDGRYYVAEVLESDSQARVRFVKGGEVTLALDELRPFALLPGARVVCPWPDWGWWTCTVLSYDAAAKRVKVTDGWGTNKTFSIGEVRLDPPRRSHPWIARVFGSGLGHLVAALIGAGVMWLILR